MTQKNSARDLGFGSGVGLGVFAGIFIGLIMFMQDMWSTISGLYFDYAYEAVVLPYLTYAMYTLYKWSEYKPINRTKAALMMIAFGLLFTPLAYLAMTQQIDSQAFIFGEFEPTLRHMPYAYCLPFIALAAVLIPYPDILHQGSSSNTDKPSYKAEEKGVMESAFLSKDKLQKHCREFGTKSIDNEKSN